MALPASRQDVGAELDDLRLASDRRLAGFGQLLMLVPALWFIQTDLALYRTDMALLMQRLLLRLVMVVVPVAGYLVVHRTRTRASYESAVLWFGLLLAAVTAGLAAFRPAGSGLPLRSPLLVICILYFAMPASLWRQASAPLALSAGLIALRTMRLTGGGIDVAGDVFAIIMLNALGILTVVRRLRLDAASNEVVRELKALRGIIPICSYCRKVRSEVGDWQQIE
ncbi:MAG: hypothetical protein KAY59_01215, partial [Acidobacteria bacterium]|nr:hypothetical protein [Acidobacteriota bacterium]